MPPKSFRHSTATETPEFHQTRAQVNSFVQSTIHGLFKAFNTGTSNQTATEKLLSLEQRIRNVDTALAARQRWDDTIKTDTQRAIRDAEATIESFQSGKLTENLAALPSTANVKFPKTEVRSLLNFVRTFDIDDIAGASRGKAFKTLFEKVKTAVDTQTIGPRLTSAAAKVKTSFELQSQDRQDPSKKSSLFKDLVDYRNTIQQYSLYPTVPTKDQSNSANSKKCYAEIRNILEKDTQKLGSIEPQSDDLHQLSRRVQHALLGLEKEMRAHRVSGDSAGGIILVENTSDKSSAATGAHLKTPKRNSADGEESRLTKLVHTASEECKKLIVDWTKATDDESATHEDLLSVLKPQIDAATKSMLELEQAHKIRSARIRTRTNKRFAELRPSTAGSGSDAGPETAFKENMGKLAQGYEVLKDLKDNPERTFANASRNMLVLLKSLNGGGAGEDNHETASGDETESEGGIRLPEADQGSEA